MAGDTPLSSPNKQTWRDRLGMPIILFIVFMDAVGVGIIYPVTPPLLMELTGEGLSQAAFYGGMLVALYSIMAFISAPIIGNLSDRFGRRPILIITTGTFCIDYLIMGFAPTLAWLFVGRALAGVSGASIAAANAYVADVSTPEDRAAKFGLIAAAWGAGFVTGPAVGGILGEFGTRVPFFVAAAAMGSAFLVVLLFLPESLAKENRRPFQWARANSLGTLRSMRKHPLVFGLLGVYLIVSIAHAALVAWPYYAPFKFGWSPAQVGITLALFGIGTILANAFLIKPLVARFGEAKVFYLGTLIGVTGYLGLTFAPLAWMLFPIFLYFSLTNMAQSANNAIMSRSIPADAQGELQGAIAALANLSAAFAPLVMTFLFQTFTRDEGTLMFPGAPFVTAAVILCLAIFFFARVMRSEDQSKS